MNKSNPQEWEFSLFFNPTKGLYNCTPYKTIKLGELFNIYKSEYLQERSNELAKASDEEKQIIKDALPYITPTGVYSYRNNDSLLQFNNSIIALDIDEVSEEDAILIQKILSEQRGCVISIISPRKKGVKALFFLGCNIDSTNYYKTTTESKKLIAESLNIHSFENNIDVNQFKLSQPFFLAYSEHHFFNIDAFPTFWEIENLPIKEIEYVAPPVRTTQISDREEKRMYAYFDKIISNLERLFSTLKKGERHMNIWRVGSVAKYLHYLPSYESQFKDRLFDAVCGMYQSTEIAPARVKKTFESVLNHRDAQPAANSFLDDIIEDEKQKRIKEEEDKKKKNLLTKNHLNND